MLQAESCSGLGSDPIKDRATDYYNAGNEVVDFFGNSYYDLNITWGCFLVGTVGIQFSWKQGFFPYAGGGVGTCGIAGAFTIGPNQPVTPGLQCGGQGSYLYPVGWAGVGPVLQGGRSGIFTDYESTFREVGVAGGFGLPISASLTCFFVDKDF